MKKRYEAPMFEKIAFDYKVHTTANSDPPLSCFGSVINVTTGDSVCGEGTPAYIGWNLKNPGQI
ncbi:MAG: hypothetical protein IKP22_06055 [Clostridia bacterium]|nr:hypothetical protein [Clostridia bacterium]